MKTTSLADLARLFLKLGILGFGGPAAHIALMEQEVVTRRGWMTREKLLELIAITHLIPGPNSTELAIHIGWAQRGWRGLLLAGLCFIGPAAILTGLLAWIYVTYGDLPQAGPMLEGIKPVMCIIILMVLIKFAQKTCRGFAPSLYAVLVFAFVLAHVPEVFALLGVALLAMVWQSKNSFFPGSKVYSMLWPFFALITTLPQSANKALTEGQLPQLCATFLKIGSILFGSGYVLLAYLEADFVDRLGWLTHEQVLDAVAAGQLTPGPVLTTSTFIGYLIAGPTGSVLATGAMFLPSFLFIIAVQPLLSKLQDTPLFEGFLKGATAGSVGLLAIALVKLGGAFQWSLGHGLLASITLIVLILRPRTNTAWLIPGGMVGGLILQQIGLF